MAQTASRKVEQYATSETISGDSKQDRFGVGNAEAASDDKAICNGSDLCQKEDAIDANGSVPQ